MTAEMILFIILNMLRMDNATEARIESAMPHLTQLADAIHVHQDADVPAVRLIALAYEETRFSYRNPKTVSSDGACGVYQQLPKYAPIKGTTCKHLFNVYTATKNAKLYLKYIQKRFAKTKLSTVIDAKMCHYYSGNKCDKEAVAYAKRHERSRKRAMKLLNKKNPILRVFREVGPPERL